MIENVMLTLGSVLPTHLQEEVKANLQRALSHTLENMEIVTREEIEVQETVLQRAREKIIELETRIEELEAQHRELAR